MKVWKFVKKTFVFFGISSCLRISSGLIRQSASGWKALNKL